MWTVRTQRRQTFCCKFIFRLAWNCKNLRIDVVSFVSLNFNNFNVLQKRWSDDQMCPSPFKYNTIKLIITMIVAATTRRWWTHFSCTLKWNTWRADVFNALINYIILRWRHKYHISQITRFSAKLTFGSQILHQCQCVPEHPIQSNSVPHRCGHWTVHATMHIKF